MNFGFAWGNKNDVYDSKVHFREDEKILKIKMVHEEGKPAVAHVLVSGSRSPPSAHVFLSFQGTLFFRGRLIDRPIFHEKGKSLLIFSAQAENAQEQKDQHLSDIHKKTRRDPLFETVADPAKETDILNHHQKIFHWCRLSGQVSLASFFEGEPLDLSKDIFEDTLKIRQVRPSLGGVHVKVLFNWVQQCQGVRDITPLIQEKIGGPFLSTFTGASLQKGWFQKSRKGQTSRFWVEDARLDHMTSLPSNFYPSASRWFYQTVDSGYQKICFSRHWFRPHLRIGWHYQQRRREIIHFYIGEKSPSKKLVFHFHDVVGSNHIWRRNHRYSKGFKVVYDQQVYRCRQMHVSGAQFDAKMWTWLSRQFHVSDQSYRATFYNTDRGRRLLSEISAMAQTHYKAGQRVQEVTGRVPISRAIKISPIHKGSVRHENMKIQGKVKRLVIYADGEGQGYGAFTLAVEKQDAGGSPFVSEDDFSAQEDEIVDEEWSTNVEGVAYPSQVQNEDLVRDIIIENGCAEQEEKVVKCQYPENKTLGTVLGQNPTKVRIAFHPLETPGILKHEVTLKKVKNG